MLNDIPGRDDVQGARAFEHSSNVSIRELVEEMRSSMLSLSDEMRISTGGLFEETRRSIKDLRMDVEDMGKPIGESDVEFLKPLYSQAANIDADAITWMTGKPCKRINRGLEDMSDSVASIKAGTTELNKNVAGMHADIKEIQMQVELLQWVSFPLLISSSRDIQCTHTSVREIASFVTTPVSAQAAAKAQEEGRDNV